MLELGSQPYTNGTAMTRLAMAPGNLPKTTHTHTHHHTSVHTLTPPGRGSNSMIGASNSAFAPLAFPADVHSLAYFTTGTVSKV